MVWKRMWYNNNMHKRVNYEGFTLVELSLSLVFIAILSVAVVLVIVGAISSYHRSLTLNKVDTAGTGLSDDMRKSIQSSTSNNLKKLCEERFGESMLEDLRVECEEDGGRNFALVTRYAEVKVGGEDIGSVPVFGAFCAGSYSYIWNSGYFFGDDYEVEEGVDKASLVYRINGVEAVKTDFKLLKVQDETRSVCEVAMRTDPNGVMDYNYKIAPFNESGRRISSRFNMSALADVGDEPVEYLGSSNDKDNNLAVYNMSTDISGQSESGRSTYYYSSFILGTVQGGINISASGNLCATPSGYNNAIENLSYCSINKFNFAALATGG